MSRLKIRGAALGIYALLFIASLLFVSGNIMNKMGNNFERGISQNGPYQLFYAFRKNKIAFKQFYFSKEDAAADKIARKVLALKGRTFLNPGTFDLYSKTKAISPKSSRPNIILITVESLSADFMTRFGRKENWTPFLDDLAHKSLFFSNFYATGVRTTRGLEAVTLSLPPTAGRSVVKRLGKEKDHWSLGSVLNSFGYHSVFFYGGDAYFDNMRSFFTSNGYDISEEKDVPENEKTFKNAWGLSDDVMVNQMIKSADLHYQKKTPFFFHWMTISNHRPFTYPAGKIDISPLAKSRGGGVKFTDWALSNLIHTAQKKPWFKNTIFVILADHDAAVAGKTSIPVKKYHIPLFIYAPALIKPREVKALGGQMDVAPTLLGLLGKSYTSYFFGKDLLHTPPSEQRAYLGTYQLLSQLRPNGDLFVLAPGKEAYLQNDKGNQPLAEKDPRLDEVISVYQAADSMVEQHLDSFSKKYPSKKK